jgi:hypothetical protein
MRDTEVGVQPISAGKCQDAKNSLLLTAKGIVSMVLSDY